MMIELPPAGIIGGKPIMEALCTENLQNLQENDIQAIITSLQSLIPNDPKTTDTKPPQVQAQQEPIT